MLIGLKGSAKQSTEYKPEFFRLKNVNDQDRLRKLLLDRPAIQIYDTIESQLSELAKINNPHKALNAEELKVFIQTYLNGQSIENIGVWVYYSWSEKLVHLLDEEDYIKIRTNRNLYKITPAELAILRQKRIGIIGLSVGQSIAITIATERICTELRLADFDTIELGNMNRLSNVNVYNLGASKAITTAQKIAELDPYIKVTCWPEGINENNIDAFMGDNAGKLDVLVEECDSLEIKILARIKAKQKRIPVIMDTNDKGMLDIERFDLEPNRPILHGKVDGLEALPAQQLLTTLRTLSIEDKVRYLTQIIGVENVSAEMMASLPEMRKTITGWPQIASAVTLGGAMITDTCRRILLNKFNASGRYFIHFNDLII